MFAIKRKRNRTRTVQNLYEALARQSNAYENYADAPIAVNPAATNLTPQVGNPTFEAQFDIQFLLYYITVSTDRYT